MKKYRVYISQINQTYYDVKASSVEAAENKARKEWAQENGPSVISVSTDEIT